VPVSPTYPGVYIEEIPSGVRTIVGVATSITALIGRTQRGPTNKATTINSFSDFDRIFGGLWLESALGYAVRDFYFNGGSQAIIVRLYHGAFATEADRKKAQDAAQAVADAATGTDAAAAAAAARTRANSFTTEPEKSAADTVAKVAETEAARTGATKDLVQNAAKAAVAGAVPYAKAKLIIGDIRLEAAYEGSWGANLRAIVDLDNISDPNLFNLTVIDTRPGGSTERFLNLSIVRGRVEAREMGWRMAPGNPTKSRRNPERKRRSEGGAYGSGQAGCIVGPNPRYCHTGREKIRKSQGCPRERSE
jgi:hypothetical protein